MTVSEYEPRNATPEDDAPTIGIMNWAIIPASRSHGFCLCIHPFMQLINFDGLSCQWCGQPVDHAKASAPGAKEIRTEAVKRMFPQFIKDGAT